MSNGVGLSFSDTLKGFRKQKRIKQEALAAKLGVHRNTIGIWERGDNLPASKGIVLEIAKQLKLNSDETRQLLEASLTALSSYWAVPYWQNPFFVGRRPSLDYLHQHLQCEQTATNPIYALSGLGGIGKTQLALEYAYQYAHEYSAVFWIAAETANTIFSSFVDIAEQLHLPELEGGDQQKLAKAVLSWLSTHKEWLLIFDNVEDIILLKSYLPSARQGAILITTRQHMLEGLAHSLEISPLSLEEGCHFLLLRSKLIDTIIPLENLASELVEEASALVKAMDGLPLALDQAGAYIERNGCSLLDYLQLFQNHQSYLLDKRSEHADHPYSVVRTFLLSFEQLEKENALAADFLRLCVFLAPDGIPENLFAQGKTHFEDSLGTVVSNPLLFNEMLGDILRYSLITRQSQFHTISVHRLVQAVFLSTLKLAAQNLWLQYVVTLLNEVLLQHSQPDMWKRCQIYIPHVITCVEYISLNHLVSDEALQLLECSGDYLAKQGQYNQAEKIFQRLLLLQDRVHGEKHIAIGRINQSLARLFQAMDNYERSLFYFQRALDLYEQLLPADDYRIGTALNDIGIMYCEIRNYPEAERCFNKALTIYEKMAEPDLTELGDIYHNLACISIAHSAYAQAQQTLLRALSLKEQIYGLNHHTIAYSYICLSATYIFQADYQQAELFCRFALHIWEQSWSFDHPQIIETQITLVEILTAQGKKIQAFELLEHIFDIFQSKDEIVGHIISIITAFTALALLLTEQGYHTEAEINLQQALKICRRRLPPHHTKLAIVLYFLGRNALSRGDDAQAEKFLQQALANYTKTLVPNHHFRGKVISSLAVISLHRNQLSLAKEQAQKALDIFDRELRREHPDRVWLLQAFAREGISLIAGR